MALNFDGRYTPDSIPPDANYPYGSFKNETAPGNLDGTPAERDWANDILGLQQKLLDYANIVPSGVPDTIISSDYFNALQKTYEARIVFSDNATGTADAIIIISIGSAPEVYRDGMMVLFKASLSNTGAATLQIDTLAPKSLTNPAGGALDAGDVLADKYVFAVFNAAADRFELIFKPVELHGRGAIDGLVMENDASDPVNDILINPGETRSDTNDLDMFLISPLVKQIDVPWTLGNGGGFPAGISLINSTWYHDFMVGNSAGLTDFGFDTSPVAANLLADPNVIAAGLDKYRRIGSTYRDIGTNKAFIQIGDEFIWVTPVVSFVSGSQGVGATNVSMRTPPDFNCEAFFNLNIGHASQARLVYVSSLFQVNQAPTGVLGGAPGLSERVGSGYLNSGGQQHVWTNASRQIRLRSSGSSTQVEIITIGYKDQRNKDLQ